MHTLGSIDFRWDPKKATANLQKLGVDFADAVGVFFDDLALTMEDEGSVEERYVTVGWTRSGGSSSWSLRLDEDVVEWFRDQTHEAGGGNDQTLIHAALREHMESRVEPLEETLRRVVREELRRKAS